MLTKQQIHQIENWLYANARPLEVAKWNLTFDKGTRASLINELVKFQNPDGGFGHGLEADIMTPESSAICSNEAVFTSKEYGLNLDADWGRRLLAWFENTAMDIPSFWEAVPKSVENYPHAPWWGYPPNTEFSPNPCAAVASALLSGKVSQRALGEKIAGRCVDFLLHDESYGHMHDTYCLQPLFLALLDTGSPLVTPEATAAMNRRILSGVCLDQSKWTGYEAQPLDFVSSPDSYWHDLLSKEIPANLDYWESTLSAAGFWPPNWDYGADTEFTRAATRTWMGYLAVRRVEVLKAFDRVEN